MNESTSQRSVHASRTRPQRTIAFALCSIVLLLIIGKFMLGDSNSQRSTGELLTHTVARGSMVVSVTEQGTLESSENTEIKCKVRGQNTITWVIPNGTIVEPGDELARLDTLFIEEQINERSKYAHWSRSGAEHWRATVARAKLAVPEYVEGRYVTQMMTLEKDLAIAESNLRTAQNMLSHAKLMHERGYRSKLDVEELEFAVERSKLSLDLQKASIDVLRDYSRKMELETLQGNLKAAEAEFAASDERADADAARRDRALEEFKHCVVRAQRGGMVIYPTAAAWENKPDIEEGATVHKNQVLLLMPDLDKMQVKVGIHESLIDRVTPGLTALVTLPDRVLEAEVSSVSSVASPSGWWTGNVVKYDTIIELPKSPGLKPGMTAAVKIILARHEDVLTLPVAAVLETPDGDFCWVKTSEGAKRHVLELGDTNDMFVVVKAGLQESDSVVLNPLSFVPEAQDEALKPQTKDTPKDSAKQDASASAGANSAEQDRSSSTP